MMIKHNVYNMCALDYKATMTLTTNPVKSKLHKNNHNQYSVYGCQMTSGLLTE